MEPLLEAGALGRNNHMDETAIFAKGYDCTAFGDGGEVDAKDVLQHPAGFMENPVHRPNAQPVDGDFEGPKLKGLPT